MNDKALITLEDKAIQLDAVADKFSNALIESRSPFSSALVLSRGIKELRELLDDGIMREIMELANSSLGFMTDRPNEEKTDFNGKKIYPYQIGEIRDAIIEAGLRGFRPAGNEFNIIPGRFYAAKAGLHRKVVNYPHVTDFKETFGIPKLVGDKGAVVNAKATWKAHGFDQSLEREFAIKVNSQMGSDAIIGKCQRKFYAAVLNQLSGIITPEGEVEEIKDEKIGRVGEIKKPEIVHEDKIAPSPAPGIDFKMMLKRQLSDTRFTQTDLMNALHECAISENAQTIDDMPDIDVKVVLDNWKEMIHQMVKTLEQLAKQ